LKAGAREKKKKNRRSKSKTHLTAVSLQQQALEQEKAGPRKRKKVVSPFKATRGGRRRRNSRHDTYSIEGHRGIKRRT
jgi:hypothetical protein